MEVEVEEAAKCSSRRSKWQFMGARDVGANEELRQVYGVSERTIYCVDCLHAGNYFWAWWGDGCRWWRQRMVADDEDIQEIINNSKLSEGYLTLAHDI